MTKKERAVACVELLKAEFPDDLCSLTYEDPYQLLVAVRLSAQCTDARVNMVTPALFEKYPTPVEMAAADVEDVRQETWSSWRTRYWTALMGRSLRLSKN